MIWTLSLALEASKFFHLTKSSWDRRGQRSQEETDVLFLVVLFTSETSLSLMSWSSLFSVSVRTPGVGLLHDAPAEEPRRPSREFLEFPGTPRVGLRHVFTLSCLFVAADVAHFLFLMQEVAPSGSGPETSPSSPSPRNSSGPPAVMVQAAGES